MVEKFELDPIHSRIGFAVRHMVVSKVRGRFTRFTGTLLLDEDHPVNGRAVLSIEAASIDTGDPQRDQHLRSNDFLDVEHHPEIRFESDQIQKIADMGYKVTGALTIRGVTREVILEIEDGGRVKDPWGNDRVGFQALTTIHRKQWGLAWNQILEGGGLVVADKVEIECEVEAVKVKTAEAQPSL